MGAFFKSINTPRPLNSGSRLEEIINKKIEKYIKEEFNLKDNNKLNNFNNNNPAHRPTNQELNEYFCNIMEVAAIMKKLPNKTSTGIDNIPSIVLKHLSSNIIKEYKIIFNNALNNYYYYYPEAWKKSKNILPIPKMGKNLEE